MSTHGKERSAYLGSVTADLEEFCLLLQLRASLAWKSFRLRNTELCSERLVSRAAGTHYPGYTGTERVELGCTLWSPAQVEGHGFLGSQMLLRAPVLPL